jgi:uncharacterized protein YbcV (DUF1398 family)
MNSEIIFEVGLVRARSLGLGRLSASPNSFRHFPKRLKCHATLGGTMSFPEAAGKLMGAGVEYYHVDYVRLRKTFYSAEGGTMTVPIAFDALPPVAPELDVAALRANILDSQRHGQPFREFTRRAMAGGVQGYIAFLRGKRVMYWGRNGEQHVEWFPGAKPSATKP